MHAFRRHVISPEHLILAAIKEIFMESAISARTVADNMQPAAGNKVLSHRDAHSSPRILCTHRDGGSRHLCDALFHSAFDAETAVRRYEIVGGSRVPGDHMRPRHQRHTEIRQARAVVPYSLIIVIDGLSLLLDIDGGRTWVIHDKGAQGYVVRLFELMWNISEATADEPDHVPQHLGPVLAQVAQGKTDNAARRATGLSPRTYSRRMAELQSRLNARNRFQAGIMAAHRGWV